MLHHCRNTELGRRWFIYAMYTMRLQIFFGKKDPVDMDILNSLASVSNDEMKSITAQLRQGWCKQSSRTKARQVRGKRKILSTRK